MDGDGAPISSIDDSGERDHRLSDREALLEAQAAEYDRLHRAHMAKLQSQETTAPGTDQPSADDEERGECPPEQLLAEIRDVLSRFK